MNLLEKVKVNLSRSRRYWEMLVNPVGLCFGCESVGILK